MMPDFRLLGGPQTYLPPPPRPGYGGIVGASQTGGGAGPMPFGQPGKDNSQSVPGQMPPNVFNGTPGGGWGMPGGQPGPAKLNSAPQQQNKGNNQPQPYGQGGGQFGMR